jgi:hypothetical protein
MNPLVFIQEYKNWIIEGFVWFQRKHELQYIEMEPLRFHNAIAKFAKQYTHDRFCYDSQLDDDFKEVGHLVFSLITNKPIMLKSELSALQYNNPIHKVINEEFALFNALRILEINESYISDKTFHSRFIESLHSRNERGDLSAESVVKDIKELYNRVPEYFKPKTHSRSS